jgi:hypothetical protein
MQDKLVNQNEKLIEKLQEVMKRSSTTSNTPRTCSSAERSFAKGRSGRGKVTKQRKKRLNGRD